MIIYPWYVFLLQNSLNPFFESYTAWETPLNSLHPQYHMLSVEGELKIVFLR